MFVIDGITDFIFGGAGWSFQLRANGASHERDLSLGENNCMHLFPKFPSIVIIILHASLP